MNSKTKCERYSSVCPYELPEIWNFITILCTGSRIVGLVYKVEISWAGREGCSLKNWTRIGNMLVACFSRGACFHCIGNAMIIITYRNIEVWPHDSERAIIIIICLQKSIQKMINLCKCLNVWGQKQLKSWPFVFALFERCKWIFRALSIEYFWYLFYDWNVC